MEIECIPFRKTGYFSELICDYLEEVKALESFYNRFPTLQNFGKQIQEKSKNYPKSNRKILVETLLEQYKSFKVSEATLKNIKSLEQENTFTIVTGHQLNLFTGPLYFIYKIISTINLCEELKDAYPNNHFVPIYWMASEDHDFDEINYFNFEGKKIQWNREVGGAVGRMSTKELDKVFEVFGNKLGGSKSANHLKTLFKEAYLEQKSLAQATLHLANTLFAEFGLVVIDADHTKLKALLVPYMKQDIFENLPFKKISQTNERLSKVSEKYKIQVSPRAINYFYLKEGLRERIIAQDDSFIVNNTDITFSKQAIVEEMSLHPENFSPNVVARPLYQEVILPNLCYIGGGGELAYWLELKDYFDALDITFPMLLLRNSALIITEKQAQKVKKLDLTLTDLFLEQNNLINKKIRQISNIDIDLSPQKLALETQFTHLYQLAEQTDKSFVGAVKAQEVKQKKGLDKLEKRLLKAQKRKLKDQVKRLIEIHIELFPNKSLQERQLNFSALYLEYGAELVPMLKKALQPLKNSFLVLRG